jgi:tripartite-type tricarboxylate transporter receptor subunit TctC
MLALLAGTIDVVATSLPSAVPQIQGGQARGIGVTSERRNQALPDVPTIAEAGFEPIVDVAWVAVFYPTGTPQAVLERVNADVQRAMVRPTFQQRLAAMGFDPIGGDLARAQEYVTGEIALWRDIVRTVNVQID